MDCGKVFMGMFLSCITGILQEQENLHLPLLCKEGIGEGESSTKNGGYMAVHLFRLQPFDQLRIQHERVGVTVTSWVRVRSP